MHLTSLSLLAAVAVTLFGCEKPKAEFRVHDKVIVKLTDTTGEVVLRMKPFVDDLYYLKVPGKKSSLDREHTEWWWWYRVDGPEWHIEGPYHYTDLQASR